ncbi:uncharacterized protein PHACADRAFT_211549 [Phanerochaete carnosa HHB-10118-sp]|uniref:AMP-dependent synthetase/ligase domain-containing protein n=1 Tax=Phanerochaete carnosa (strain HHB-10118-sp) TaxID=650164 RepID=K5WPK2_PHACS|nr:uncharacterized protein PHACADRAFT_211549 [Phanerochaete carnosa HHB-10118-sp]EKM52277.1 hypothetical protein PHACADRAFT_211549 [Phanerochaete carnosa HHB-10118-sp]
MLRAGLAVAPIALTNSPAAIAHLLRETSTTHVLVSDDKPARTLVDAVLELIVDAGGQPPVAVPMPKFAEIFDKDRPAEFLPERVYDYTSPAIYVHSSGSTSLPKPIAWTHASFLQVAATPCFGSHDLRDEVFGIQGLSMAHASGLNHIAFLVSSGYTAATLPPGPPYVIPTPEIVMDSFRDTKPTFVICVPSYLEAWSHTEEDIDVLKSLKAIGYGGGPLAKALGDALVTKGVPVCALYGSSCNDCDRAKNAGLRRRIGVGVDVGARQACNGPACSVHGGDDVMIREAHELAALTILEPSIGGCLKVHPSLGDGIGTGSTHLSVAGMSK